MTHRSHIYPKSWTLDWTGIWTVFFLQHVHKNETPKADDSLLTLFQVAFGLPIAFSVNVEGSVIEMKPVAPAAPEDNAVAKPKS